MYKVKRTAEGNLTSQGTLFEFGKEVVVTDIVYNYLKKTFPNDFSFEEAKKEKVVEKKTSMKRTRKTKEVVTK